MLVAALKDQMVMVVRLLSAMTHLDLSVQLRTFFQRQHPHQLGERGFRGEVESAHHT